ncbi:carbohydrate-binding protein [Photobacterium atrarenae]|uniref:Chitin-binding type-3 domain-containing protein n=1 Tax=Photobacterium atrarenae TaxID=865757 RepID=A0ABY5GKL2_9GAMM|nr:carbohydrate-binding protein [Photobacterium atrarenae]UTV29686.1 hypothetical protein NNL38_22000 [Photobacterium atrarenae]
MKKHVIAIAVSLSIPLVAHAMEPWNKDTVYNSGDLVTHHGESFVSSHWTQGTEPVVNDISWDGWIHINADTIDNYEHETPYAGGSVVNFEGDIYLAKWWVQGEYPSKSGTWRLLDDLEPSPDPDPDPDPDLDPKSPEAIVGVDKDNNGVRDSYEVAVTEAYQNPQIVQLAINLGLEYTDINEIALDKSIQLSVEDATKKYNEILVLEECAEELLKTGVIEMTPLELHTDTLYRALTYRNGKERIFEQMEHDLDAILTIEQPCVGKMAEEAVK